MQSGRCVGASEPQPGWSFCGVPCSPQHGHVAKSNHTCRPVSCAGRLRKRSQAQGLEARVFLLSECRWGGAWVTGSWHSRGASPHHPFSDLGRREAPKASRGQGHAFAALSPGTPTLFSTLHPSWLRCLLPRLSGCLGVGSSGRKHSWGTRTPYSELVLSRTESPEIRPWCQGGLHFHAFHHLFCSVTSDQILRHCDSQFPYP